MAFRDYRDSFKNSVRHEFDIERFAFDVFAYMLRICGFPEEKIPTSNLKNNIYIANDFVMNVGLSALPIALYSRDEWRFVFEGIFGESGNCDILEIQNYLESFIAYSGEFEEEDTLSKIQFSLALYNEYILFLEFKGIEIFLDKIPKLWGHLCKELFAQTEEFYEANESSLTMCPDVSESWIYNFIRNFAIPYGSSDEVSEKFSVLTLECHSEEIDIFPGKRPEEESGAVSPSGGSEDCTRTIFPVLSNSNSKSYFPHVCESDVHLGPPTILKQGGAETYTEEDNKAVSPPDDSTKTILSNIANPLWKSEEYSGPSTVLKQEDLVERRPQIRHKNGLRYVLDKCRGTKRGRSQELEVHNAFGRMKIEKENLSPENRDTKRRRRSSGKDKLK